MSKEHPTKEEYVKAAEDRVHDFLKATGVEVSEVAFTAIRVELRTMYEVGEQNAKKENKVGD